MSVYQLKYMDRVPDSAVCNEAVKLAGKRGLKSLGGFVNGVLRNIARNLSELVYSDNRSVFFSMPEWIIEMWDTDYGEEITNRILRGLTIEQKISVRCNLSIAEKEIIMQSLEADGVTVEPVEGLKKLYSSII
jgi:16S rRNA (cytosine967-C5)-methyltransferase